MKTKIIVVVTIGALILSFWYAHIVKKQKKSLQQSGERLRATQQHIDNGNLKAANSLLIQTGIDLANIDKFYTMPFIDKQRQELSDQLKDVREHFQRNLATIQAVLDELTSTMSSGNFHEAEETIRSALSRSNRNATLLELARYFDRLKAQDFKGAEESIVKVKATLPDELNIVQIASTLAEFVQSERDANYERQSSIANAVKSQIDLTYGRASYGFKPVLKGRAMVWDFTKNAIDQAYELLPDDLRASSRDGNVTIFCIVKRENIEVGRYSISNQPAYKEKMTIGVVYWPDKESPGTAIVWGGNPPSSRPVRYSPEYGSSVKIKEWVAGLSRN